MKYAKMLKKVILVHKDHKGHRDLMVSKVQQVHWVFKVSQEQ
jgi:hypothetical protein